MNDMEFNPNDRTIRDAKQEDIKAILEIYNDAILHTTAVYSYDPLTYPMMDQWYREKAEKKLPVFVAESGGVVAGYASYGPFRPWPAYRYTIEHSIYVDRAFRRRGIAGSLLERLIRAARENGVHCIVAGIDSENGDSIRLHRRFGFAESGLLSQVGYKFDRWLDLQFMQLVLQKDDHGE